MNISDKPFWCSRSIWFHGQRCKGIGVDIGDKGDKPLDILGDTPPPYKIEGGGSTIERVGTF